MTESSRDRHLFGEGPKRILSLDGGGVRGAITIAILEKLEAILNPPGGPRVRLCDYFDLIGGTSTGAIIATALALGHSASDVRDFYLRLGPHVFHKKWHVVGLQAKFDAALLQGELDSVIGQRTLDSPDILTGLAMVMKRIDTGSPWIISNNPRARYWNTPADKSYIGNGTFRIANLVRASAAAPHYFDPELLEICEGMPPGLFVDGGVSPHNNPAAQLLLMAALDGFGLRWPLGPDKLSIVSIGTGTFRRHLIAPTVTKYSSAVLAAQALTGLISDTQTFALTLLHWLSGTHPLWPINTEIGSLEPDAAPFGTPLFRFHRYDAQLDESWLEHELGLKMPQKEVERVRHMDDPSIIPQAYQIGKLVAEKFMKAEDFAPASSATA